MSRSILVNLNVEVEAEDERSPSEIAQALFFDAIDGTVLNAQNLRVAMLGCAEQTEATMQFEPYEQTNPKAHARGPYALRYAGGRPEGSFPTITEAVAAARPGASVVTADGWWIVGRCAEQTEAT